MRDTLFIPKRTRQKKNFTWYRIMLYSFGYNDNYYDILSLVFHLPNKIINSWKILINFGRKTFKMWSL